jgi:hypothetical protein
MFCVSDVLTMFNTFQVVKEEIVSQMKGCKWNSTNNLGSSIVSMSACANAPL